MLIFPRSSNGIRQHEAVTMGCYFRDRGYSYCCVDEVLQGNWWSSMNFQVQSLARLIPCTPHLMKHIILYILIKNIACHCSVILDSLYLFIQLVQNEGLLLFCVQIQLFLLLPLVVIWYQIQGISYGSAGSKHLRDNWCGQRQATLDLDCFLDAPEPPLTLCSPKQGQPLWRPAASQSPPSSLFRTIALPPPFKLLQDMLER